jgi:hypothetical protein
MLTQTPLQRRIIPTPEHGASPAGLDEVVELEVEAPRLRTCEAGSALDRSPSSYRMSNVPFARTALTFPGYH